MGGNGEDADKKIQSNKMNKWNILIYDLMSIVNFNVLYAGVLLNKSVDAVAQWGKWVPM